MSYNTLEDCANAFECLIVKLASKDGARAVAHEIDKFISEDYYYPYLIGEEGAGIDVDLGDDLGAKKGLPHFCVETFGFVSFRNYILGSIAGVARGVKEDFSKIELIVDGTLVRSVSIM